MICSIKSGNKDRFRTGAFQMCFASLCASTPIRKRISCFEFSQCLSRACLDKIIVFSTKWRKKTRFLTFRIIATVPACTASGSSSPYALGGTAGTNSPAALSHLCIKIILLPSQARDNHRENSNSPAALSWRATGTSVERCAESGHGGSASGWRNRWSPLGSGSIQLPRMTLRKRSVFECFPCVCPEPVLVK